MSTPFAISRAQQFARSPLGAQPDLTGLSLSLDVPRLPRIDLEGAGLVAGLLGS
jgi:hypothetical protein